MVDSELIKFKGVTKKFKKNLVVDSLSFNIPENKITGLIGASGSGKTTVLKLMIGAYRPTKGKVTYLKKDIKKEMKDIEKYFGFATEDGSFYDKLTVKENIHYFGKLQKMKNKKIKQNCETLIKLVGLENSRNTLAENLSIGMKKRLDISCALIHNPKVLIMDEPTSDLDPVLRKEIMDLIKKINKTGTTIILTTQLLSEADDLLGHILILHNKKIIEDGTPKKIAGKYNKKTINDVFEKIFRKNNKTKDDKKSKSKKSSKRNSSRVKTKKELNEILNKSNFE